MQFRIRRKAILIRSYTDPLALKAEPKILGLDSAFCLLGNRKILKDLKAISWLQERLGEIRGRKIS